MKGIEIDCARQLEREEGESTKNALFGLRGDNAAL